MSPWEWQSYTASINCDRLIAMDLLRTKLLWEFDDSWLCGKPVGGAEKQPLWL